MYNKYKLKQKLRAIMEGKPGPEHERLLKELKEWAKGRNFILELERFNNGLKPDVLMGHDNKVYIFVGDAKDSNNETSSNIETLSRIQNYFCEFANLLGPGHYKGGILAIATNSLEAAKEWVEALNFLARRSNLTGEKGTPPDFRIEEINSGRTWIIWW